MRYIIIGNSTAGIGCAEGIRSLDSSGDIVIITKENYHTYSRPLISYFLQGKVAFEGMRYRSDDFYTDNNIRLVTGREVVSIDSQTKDIVLDDGERLPYDKLMIATGSTPFVPAIPGLKSVPNAFTFMSADDALEIKKHLRADSRVLILGAGLIGLKCAEALHEKCASIEVVDLADRILPNVLDTEAAQMVQSFLETKGIRFYLSSSIEHFDSGKATLSDGQYLAFDLLVTAVGVRPCTQLLCELCSDAARGIKVNEKLETAVPDVYAAGDCTVSYDISCGQERVLALLPNAYLQGEVAGKNMAGADEKYENAIPMNSTKLLGLPIITAGSYCGDAYVVSDQNRYKKLVTKDNHLIGFILVGNIERAGIYTSLISEQTPLDSIDFDLIKEKPQLMAFSKATRLEKLGGLKNA